MRVFYGIKGNNYLIMCRDFDECYVFNSFGSLEGTGALVSDCNNWVEVDVLSIVSTDLVKCEIMFNGEKSILNKSLVDCIGVSRKLGNYLGTIFTISHQDEVGKFTQVVFVFPKGLITKSTVSDRFSVNSWNSLS